MRLATRNPTEYFATLEDENELAAEIWDRVKDFYVRMRGRLYYLRAAESFRMYYGLRTAEDPFDVTAITMGGPTGSHSFIKVNHYYSFGQSLVAMATANKPDWVAIPANSDSKSIQSKEVGQKLLDSYMRETNFETAVRQAVESAVIMQDGYVLLTWDPTAGGQITPEIPGDPESGEPGLAPQYAGDVKVRALTPFDVVDDLDWRGSGERPWRITREFVNKWDLAAQFPDKHDEIITAWYDIATEGLEPAWTAGTSFGEDYRPNKDQVAVFTLWHRKTKAVPQGKMVMILNSNVCLFNGGMPYGDHLPLHQMAPAIQAGTTLGHSPQINLISVQKAISAAWSANITNLSLFGAGSMLIPKGSGLNVTDIGGGAMGIEYDPVNGAPTPMNVPGIGAQVIEMSKELVRSAGTLVGSPDIMRGTTPPQSSGALQALTMQTAVQYSSGLIQGYNRLLESTGTALIKILQTYAKSPKLALIVGKSKAPMLQEFSSESIAGITRVIVQSGNAMSKTPGGMLAMADTLLQNKMLTAPQYMAVANTGTLESELSAPTTQKSLIARENEMLSAARLATPEEIQSGACTQVVGPDGGPMMLAKLPRALFTDNHPWHEAEHATVLDSPEMRDNVFAIAAVQYHMGEHKGFGMVPDGGIPPVMPPGTPPPNMNPTPPPPAPINPNANGGGPGPDGNAPPPAPGAPGPGGPGGPKLPQQPAPAQSPLAGQSPVGAG